MCSFFAFQEGIYNIFHRNSIGKKSVLFALKEQNLQYIYWGAVKVLQADVHDTILCGDKLESFCCFECALSRLCRVWERSCTHWSLIKASNLLLALLAFSFYLFIQCLQTLFFSGSNFTSPR